MVCRSRVMIEGVSASKIVSLELRIRRSEKMISIMLREREGECVTYGVDSTSRPDHALCLSLAGCQSLVCVGVSGLISKFRPCKPPRQNGDTRIYWMSSYPDQGSNLACTSSYFQTITESLEVVTRT